MGADRTVVSWNWLVIVAICVGTCTLWGWYDRSRALVAVSDDDSEEQTETV